MSRPPALQRAIKIILLILPIAVLGNLIYTGVTTGHTGFMTILRVPFYWLLLAVLFSLFPWVFAYLRLRVWSSFFRLNLTSRELAEIVLANDVAAAATPTAMGGGYAKIGLLIFHGVKSGLAASLMVIGSIEDYLSMAIVVPIVWMFFAPEHLSFWAMMQKILAAAAQLPSFLPVTVLGVFSAAVFIWAFPTTRGILLRFLPTEWLKKRLVQPLKQVFADFKNAFQVISRGGKRIFALNVFLAALQWIMRYSIFTFIAAGLGLHPDPVAFFLMQWLVYMLMNFVPTPGAIGGAEVMFILVFRGAIPPDLLPVASAAWRFVSTYLMLIVAAVLMMLVQKPTLRKKRKTPEPIAPFDSTDSRPLAPPVYPLPAPTADAPH
ncbi:MAG: lysylphosphatidylglycerol synthase transmembrane domain-containing protein [candidate division KSB1 bacterium]|nr:lysylphosphatidylglycerol synthase transmembrane domain-containing protein [candidate division KSB1 bacterium]